MNKQTVAGFAVRAFSFIIRKLIVIACVAFLLLLLGLEAYNIANIYIISNEATIKRADYILTGTSTTALETFFTEKCLADDTLLNSGCYDSYTISNYDSRFAMKSISVMPWSDTATITIEEKMLNLTGEANYEDVEQNVPIWPVGIRKFTLIKVDGNWMIDSVEVVEDLSPTPTPVPTPTPEPTPDPDAEATPEA